MKILLYIGFLAILVQFMLFPQQVNAESLLAPKNLRLDKIVCNDIYPTAYVRWDPVPGANSYVVSNFDLKGVAMGGTEVHELESVIGLYMLSDSMVKVRAFLEENVDGKIKATKRSELSNALTFSSSNLADKCGFKIKNGVVVPLKPVLPTPVSTIDPNQPIINITPPPSLHIDPSKDENLMRMIPDLFKQFFKLLNIPYPFGPDFDITKLFR